jgi:hypothetical protein
METSKKLHLNYLGEFPEKQKKDSINNGSCRLIPWGVATIALMTMPRYNTVQRTCHSRVGTNGTNIPLGLFGQILHHWQATLL